MHIGKERGLCVASELSYIQIDYASLKLDSQNARYGCYDYTGQDVGKDLIPLLEQIENHVSKLLQLR